MAVVIAEVVFVVVALFDVVVVDIVVLLSSVFKTVASPLTTVGISTLATESRMKRCYVIETGLSDF